jgi:V/A-type H+-transporting ATPase subunit D
VVDRRLTGRAGRLAARHRLAAARRAVDLLDRKLRILRAEQERAASLARRGRERWTAAAGDADRALVRLALIGGQRAVRLATPARPAAVELTWTTVMGVRYPDGATVTPGGPPVCGTAAAAAEAARAALAAAVDAAVAAAAERALSAEAARVRRRLRAVEDRWVPRLEETLAELNRRIEEDERAEAVRLRWAAARSGRP